PVPVHISLLRGLFSHDAFELDRVSARLLLQAPVLDDVLGGLRDDIPSLVETFASGPAANLLKLAHAQDGRLFAVVLAEAREQDGSNRDVYADAKRVGAADDGEQPLLREALDEQPILRQETRVVQTNSVRKKALHLFAERRIEPHAPELCADFLFLVFGDEVEAHQVL